ncbi:uncharacterized protein [Amphiura filiformis]|uniref:uncharacterized protein n=1 Tax=Amphiura filiformis TaxID=82378 RepID=UPI003B2192B6
MAGQLAILFWVMLVISLSEVDCFKPAADVYNHECYRECKWPPEPKTCRYVFTVEWQESMSAACFDCPFNMTDCDRPGCIPANGVERPIIVVNRQLPGPQIQVCEGDNVQVKVWNRLGNSEGVSIHWHAIHQRGTPYMDGATMITQCPISPQSSFTYNFKASPAGTQWWHSHSNWQRADGAFGAFIIKQAPNRDPNSDLYDFDLPEHVAIIQAWSNLPASPIGATTGNSLTINAKGRFESFEREDSDEIVYTPREIFRVQPDKRYRFRVIGNNACHLEVSIDNHNLTVIAADGAPIQNISVDRIGVGSGERFDFVLTADQDVGNYWFRVQVSRGFFCRNGLQEELAILRYEGAPQEDPGDRASPEGGLILNPAALETPNGITLLQIDSTDATDEKLQSTPDQQFYFELGSARLPGSHMFDSEDYPNPPLSEATEGFFHVNFVSFKFPPSPLLTQMEDINTKEFCSAGVNLAERRSVPANTVVEVVLVSERSTHPMHIHGYSLRVVGVGKLPRGTTVEDVIELDQQGNITRKLDNAVLKDTISVESGSYYIFRFLADNPGQWLFHCHDIFHLMDGMAIVLQVGETSDLPPIPEDFPRCGSWSKPAYENQKERKNGESVEPIEPAEKRRKQPSAE